MRKLFLLLSTVAVALTTSVYADLGLPGELAPDILDKTIVINGQTCHVVRTIDKNNLDIKVLSKKGKEIWRSIALGMQAWDFKLNDKISSFEIADLDGDKVPEIITACTTGDVQSAMYVFKYDPKRRNFRPMDFGYEGTDLVRDFMVSDIPATEGENMVFINNTTIRTLGKIYTDDGAVPGYYYFTLKKGKFMCTKQEPAKLKDNPLSPIVEGNLEDIEDLDLTEDEL